MFYIAIVALNGLFALASLLLSGKESIIVSVLWMLCLLIYTMNELMRVFKKRDFQFYSRMISSSLTYLAFSGIIFMIKLFDHNISHLGIAIHLVFIFIVASLLIDIYIDYTKNK